MPKTPLQTEILGAIEIVAGAYFDSPFLISLGKATMISGGLQELANLTAQDPSKQALQAVIRSTTANMPLVYGQTKIGGVLAFSDTYGGIDNPYLCIAVAHSLSQMNGSNGLGVSSVKDVWIDNIQIPDANIDASGNVTAGPGGSDAYGNPLSPWNPLVGNLVVKRYTGSQTGADSTLTSNFSSYWKLTAIGKGVAYTMFQLYRNPDDSSFSAAFPRGIPGFMGSLVNGQKVYDPRQDSTNGGSGTQRFATPSTWTFSTNPALCAADYLTRAKTDGGAGIAYSGINWASVAAAANICDESITLPAYGGSGTQTTARYSCNIAIDTGQDVLSNLNLILNCMAGKCIPVAGQLYLYAGAYDSPSDDMDEGFLAGEVSLVAIPQRQSMWNMVKANYAEPLADYQTVPAQPIYNASYETADGGIRLQRTLNLPGVNNQFQAQYLEIIESQRSRNRKMLRAHCNLKAFGWKIWDTVSITLSEFGLSGDVYRVVNWQLNADQSIDVLLQEEASTTYDFSFSQFTAYAPPLFLQMQTETPAAPSGLTATAGGPGNLLQWTPPPDNSYLGQTIQRAPDSGGSPGTFATIANGVRGSSYTDTSAAAATKYWYQIAAFNIHHQTSAYCTAVAVTSSTAESGATAGATIGPGGNVDGAVDVNGRPFVDASQPGHLGAWDMDSRVANGATYGRPLVSRLNAGKPWIDFGEGIHVNKNLDYIANTVTYNKSGAAYVDASGRHVAVWDDVTGVSRSGGYVGEGSRRAQGIADSSLRVLNLYGKSASTIKSQSDTWLDNRATGSVSVGAAGWYLIASVDAVSAGRGAYTVDLSNSGGNQAPFRYTVEVHVDWSYNPTLELTAASGGTSTPIISLALVKDATNGTALLAYCDYSGTAWAFGNRLVYDPNSLAVPPIAAVSTTRYSANDASNPPATGLAFIDMTIQPIQASSSALDTWHCAATRFGAKGITKTNSISGTTTDQLLTVDSPGGAQYSYSGNTTGAIRITLPVGYGSTMMSFDVDIFNYATGNKITVHVAGYNYVPTPSWHNCTAHIIGDVSQAYTVRFGNQDGFCCVWIGELTTIWHYPKITVRNFHAGHNVSNKLVNGWNINIVSAAFGTIDQTITYTLPSGGTELAGSGKYPAQIDVDPAGGVLNNLPIDNHDPRVGAGLDADGNVARTVPDAYNALQVSGSGKKLADPRNSVAILASGLRALWSSGALTSRYRAPPLAGDQVITLNGTLYAGDAAIPYGPSTVAGLPNTSQPYWCFVNDPTTSGGALTLIVTTDDPKTHSTYAQANGYVFVGKISTVAGSISTGGGGGGLQP